MSKCPEQYRGVGYSCPRIPSDSLCIKSRNNFLLFSSSFQYSMTRLLTKVSLESMAAALTNSSSVKSRNISPLPVRSHSSLTLNSWQTESIICSVTFTMPFSIRLIAERVTPTREPNFSADSPKIVRNSLIRSFNKHPGDYQVPVLADDCEKFQGDLCLYQLWRNWMS